MEIKRERLTDLRVRQLKAEDMLRGMDDEQHAPIEIAHLGSSIWSHIRRITGAILIDTRPDRMIRSACRGEARSASHPKRAMSARAATIAIISIAQQARPKVSG